MFRGEPECLVAGCGGEQTGVVTYVDVMSRGSVQRVVSVFGYSSLETKKTKK